MASAKTPALLDLLRQVERILDDQRRTLSEENNHAEALGRMGAGILTGLLAGIAILAETGFRPTVGPALVLASGTLVTLAGTAQAIRGISRRVPQTTYLGADPTALLEHVQREDVERAVVLATLVSAGMRAAHMNERIFAELRRARGRVFILLVSGVWAILLGFGFIVGGRIFA